MGLSPMDGAEEQVSDETRKFFAHQIPPRVRSQVKIELKSDGNATRVVVSSREEGKLWEKNIELAAKKVQIHASTKLKERPYMGDDHRHGRKTAI